MIIFGFRSKQLKKVEAVELGCSVCSNQSHAAVGVGKYFHVFWIPVLMYSKRVVLQCLHCRKVSEMYEVEYEDRPNVKKTIFSLSNSWHLSFGIFAILFFIALSYTLNFFMWIGRMLFIY